MIPQRYKKYERFFTDENALLKMLTIFLLLQDASTVSCDDCPLGGHCEEFSENNEEPPCDWVTGVTTIYLNARL